MRSNFNFKLLFSKVATISEVTEVANPLLKLLTFCNFHWPLLLSSFLKDFLKEIWFKCISHTCSVNLIRLKNKTKEKHLFRFLFKSTLLLCVVFIIITIIIIIIIIPTELLKIMNVITITIMIWIWIWIATNCFQILKSCFSFLFFFLKKAIDAKSNLKKSNQIQIKSTCCFYFLDLLHLVLDLFQI